MALLSDTDPDPTPRSTLCCDSTVEVYQHSDPEKNGKKDRREIIDRARRSGFHSVLHGVGSGSVSDRSAIARHKASFFKLVEWPEQLGLANSVRLGAFRRRVQIRLCTEQRV